MSHTLPDLDRLREAGRIASSARDLGAGLIRPGARLADVCTAVEDEIVRRGGGIAFPAQTSRNAIAAHYCPPPEDETTYAEGDLAKLDIGVHVDGWVVDTATTVNLGGAEGQPLVDAARAALDAALLAVRPGIAVRQLSGLIERTIRGFGVRPMKSLCGHGVGRWTVHRRPPVPNVADASTDVLPAGATIAIEPFATFGGGDVVERGQAEVFRVAPHTGDVAGADPDILARLRAFNGLPFGRRQLTAFPRPQVEETLVALRRARVLTAYPPLVEASGRKVAQAEHTIYVGENGVEVLTR